MSEVLIHTASPETVALSVLADLRGGQISEATVRFAEDFRFRDHGIGLEFTDKVRLMEFFQKGRELYPDSTLIPDRTIACGEDAAVEWTYRVTITEPFYGGLQRRLPVSVQGASVVRTHNGEITEWADYYDGLKSRCTALAAHFEEWTEL